MMASKSRKEVEHQHWLGSFQVVDAYIVRLLRGLGFIIVLAEACNICQQTVREAHLYGSACIEFETDKVMTAWH